MMTQRPSHLLTTKVTRIYHPHFLRLRQCLVTLPKLLQSPFEAPEFAYVLVRSASGLHPSLIASPSRCSSCCNFGRANLMLTTSSNCAGHSSLLFSEPRRSSCRSCQCLQSELDDQRAADMGNWERFGTSCISASTRFSFPSLYSSHVSRDGTGLGGIHGRFRRCSLVASVHVALCVHVQTRH